MPLRMVIADLNLVRLMEGVSILLLLLLASLHIQKTNSAEIDIISDSKFLTEGDTLVSPAGILELGFFRPEGSENKYIGIWFTKTSPRRVVWVANRDHPLTGASSATLKIVHPGTLVLMNGTDDVVWSSNTTSSANPIAQLDDNGNLVVTDGIDKKNIIWQSFDYPTNTRLPGMKFGKNLVTGKEWFLSSWKSSQDAAPGDYTYRVDTRGFPQSLLKQGANIRFRASRPWNGQRSNEDIAANKNVYTTDIVINTTEVIYTYHLVNISVQTILTLNSSGHIERWVWRADQRQWPRLITKLPKDNCDTYNNCRAYGRCIISYSQGCVCLDETRFVPRNPQGWSGGCVRRTPLGCKNGSTDGFTKYSNVKFPDTRTSWFNISMNLKECEAKCLQNCSCTAYAHTDIRGQGSGCLIWFNDLLDIRVVDSQDNATQDIFVRMASSESDSAQTNSAQTDSAQTDSGKSANIKIILAIVIPGFLFISLGSMWFWYAWIKRHHMREGESQSDAMELPLFSFSTIAKATTNFSPENKLGEGGFGPVYKGILEEGKEIAVKRLSKTSSQGLDEFKNEVICISKLQHRNLVKLLGCSIEGDEKLLIYEYMPNRGLDSLIFDKTRSMLLDWTTRFNIINGIARGLLYLHQDSRLRIIHRDRKASNILLDVDMNPKISDFGVARSFGGNETQANIERVVGTYGYMSPEYALDGVFSIKSDVFSFGVLVIEIVCGMRNRGFIDPEHENNLIGYAWRMHNEGRSMELTDTNLGELEYPSEVLRSITVGLLCVQQSPEDRPNMSSVVLMLGNEGALLRPKQPAFFTQRSLHGADFSSSPTTSINGLTFSEIVSR